MEKGRSFKQRMKSISINARQIGSSLEHTVITNTKNVIGAVSCRAAELLEQAC